MTQVIVKSTHNTDGVILKNSKEFDNEEEAVSYAETLTCLVVKVFVEDKGIVYYGKPGIQETTSETV